jgi:hypothetical protein
MPQLKQDNSKALVHQIVKAFILVVFTVRCEVRIPLNTNNYLGSRTFASNSSVTPICVQGVHTLHRSLHRSRVSSMGLG